MIKQCSKCKTQHHEIEFTKDRNRKDGLSTWCRNCSKQACKQSYYDNRVARIKAACEYQKKNTNARLLKTYGITLEQRERMHEVQNGCCALCNKPESHFKSILSIDHCHVTGKVRGLLCWVCNKKLVGNHTIESITKLYNYVTKP